MLSDVTGEVEEAPSLHPVVVVHELGAVLRSGIKVKEAGQLPLYAGHVVREGLLVEKVALLGLHRRVAYHSRGASYEREGLVPAVLEMLENHDADHVPDVQ